MFKKANFWFCICVLTILMVAGFNCFKKDSSKTVYFIVKSDLDYWKIVADGANKAAAKMNINIIHEASVNEADVGEQVALVKKAIAAKPDAIVLAPTTKEALVPAVEKGFNKGIKMILIDTGVNTEKYNTLLCSDNLKIGRLAADMMAKAMKKRFGKAAGNVAGVNFMAGAGGLEKRKIGFLNRVKEKYPGINIVDFQEAQGKEGTTLKIVQNYIDAYGNDLKGIYANNQPTGNETVQYLVMIKKKDMAVVVVDSGEHEVWGLGNGYVDAVIVQKPWDMGYMGVEYAVKVLKGEKVERYIDTGVVAITPDMIGTKEAIKYLDPIEYHNK